MNPRRSSRARPNPPSSAMQPTNSSSSSTSASRAERNTRSNNKTSPSRRGSTQRSQSIDDVAVAGSQPDLAHTRHRQQHGRDDEMTTQPPPPNEEYDEEEGDEEEITRCICGQQDYPGLPIAARALLGRSSQKAGVKDELTRNASAAAPDLLPEEPGSLFIQCDNCKVWQHGGCVGIMNEEACPEEYFCEECRKDLHKIITDANGNKSSHYVPVVGPESRSSSSSSSRNNSKGTKSKKGKNSASSSLAKRRSTMNSRDAAYDEEEQLKRAIEESKEDTKSVTDETGTKKGKRSRSDSEVNKHAAKRQRTASPSPSSTPKQSRTNSDLASDDESKAKASANGNNKKTRASAARNQRDKDVQGEKEEQDTTARRKGRSERRKEVESEPPEPSANKPTPTITQSTPDTPDVGQEAAASKPTTRKTGRPARRGRVGRNQYTRDRDVNGVEGSYTNGNSPRRGQSREGGASGDSPTGPNGVYLNGGESGRPSRPRYMNPNRTSMNDMRKRVAAILEFISRMQVEMAATGEQATPPDGENGSNGGESNNATALAGALSLAQSVLGDQEETIVNGDTAQSGAAATMTTTQEGSSTEPGKGRDFKDLSSVEMMDVLTHGLLKWQQEYGKYGDK